MNDAGVTARRNPGASKQKPVSVESGDNNNSLIRRILFMIDAGGIEKRAIFSLCLVILEKMIIIFPLINCNKCSPPTVIKNTSTHKQYGWISQH